MGKKRIAEKNKALIKAIKKGNAKIVTDPDGKRRVKKEAPNVDKKQVRRSIIGTRIFYNCPRCGRVIEFKKKYHRNLCMRCGQYLDWCDYENWACVCILAESADDAGYWAAQYEAINGTLYGIDCEKWRLERKSYPMELYFAFPEGKAYGRFMRKAAKDAKIVKEFKNDV